MEQENETQEVEQESTKQERKDLAREEKQQAYEKDVRGKKMKKMIPWLIFVAVVVGVIYWIAVSAEKSDSERPGESFSIVSRDHISFGDEHPPYNSNPPTSGAHAGPAPWGFSVNAIPDENAIHNLEHGGIWISYKDLDQQSIDTLEAIARKNSLSVLVSPREANDTSVAVASWGRLMKLDSVDADLIQEYINKNKNKSPEPLAR